MNQLFIIIVSLHSVTYFLLFVLKEKQTENLWNKLWITNKQNVVKINALLNRPTLIKIIMSSIKRDKLNVKYLLI